MQANKESLHRKIAERQVDCKSVEEQLAAQTKVRGLASIDRRVYVQVSQLAIPFVTIGSNASLLQEVAELQHRVAGQTISREDVARMNNERCADDLPCLCIFDMHAGFCHGSLDASRDMPARDAKCSQQRGWALTQDT